jgi:hypothetical protein
VVRASTTRRRGSPRISGIQLEGPFFEVDVTRTVYENAHQLALRMAEVGQAEARMRAYAAPRRTAGPSFSAGLIRGRAVALGGRRWAVSAVISADTTGLDQARAIRVQAALAGRHNPIDRDGNNIGTTRGHEGTARVFSGTARSLNRLARDLDLTKGMGG